MARGLEEEIKHDTISIEWHNQDADLISKALAFYVHEINEIAMEYASGQRTTTSDLKFEKEYGPGYKFGLIILAKTKKFLNTKKVILSGYITDARPGENKGKKILTFKEGYHQKESFVRWAVKTLMN